MLRTDLKGCSITSECLVRYKRKQELEFFRSKPKYIPVIKDGRFIEARPEFIRIIMFDDFRYQIVECMIAHRIHKIKRYWFFMVLFWLFLIPSILIGSFKKRYRLTMFGFFFPLLFILFMVTIFLIGYINNLYN